MGRRGSSGRGNDFSGLRVKTSDGFKMESEYKKEREETGKILSEHDVQNKVMKRGTRMNRIANRRRR